MNAMRTGIAEHMRRSLDTAAHVTSAIEVDMSAVVAIPRAAEGGVQQELRRQPDLPASSRAPPSRRCRSYPWVNGEIRGDQIVTHNYVNLGFAVALEAARG
jgi:pyruvate/2-oxoglutarate dehydrogenase complex dihydrolipoamide acyltransferase (E2) component